MYSTLLYDDMVILPNVDYDNDDDDDDDQLMMVHTVMMRFELLAIIMSVTWSSVFPATSIPLTSRTSSLTDKRPVDSARPPGTRREMKIPGNFVRPVSVTRTLTPEEKD